MTDLEQSIRAFERWQRNALPPLPYERATELAIGLEQEIKGAHEDVTLELAVSLAYVRDQRIKEIL